MCKRRALKYTKTVELYSANQRVRLTQMVATRKEETPSRKEMRRQTDETNSGESLERHEGKVLINIFNTVRKQSKSKF